MLDEHLPSDISILVNNVGATKAAILDRLSTAEILRQININVNTMTYMTYLLLPRLLKRKERSALINISSRSAFSSEGFLPLYCATKAYNLSLSRCLNSSYGDKIDVMTVTPHGVET